LLKLEQAKAFFSKFKIQARLGSDLKATGISELSLAWVRKEVGIPSQALLGLGQKSGFKLGSSLGSETNSWLNNLYPRRDK
jgi:hypothetical protein